MIMRLKKKRLVSIKAVKFSTMTSYLISIDDDALCNISDSIFHIALIFAFELIFQI